ncbi:MAG: PhoH family protein [bacterium]|nr:PhoH family protein [bacterium]
MDNNHPEGKEIDVLDTNVLIHDSDAINHFQDHDVVLHGAAVLEELDKLKHEPDTAFEAREAIRNIDQYSNRGWVGDGISTPGGGKLYICFTKDEDFRFLPAGLEINNDNRIVLLAKLLQIKNPNRHVVFVSKDIKPRNTANACRIVAEDYKYDLIERVYTGTINIELVDCKENLIDNLYLKGFVPADEIIQSSHIKEELLIPNLGCYLSFAQQTGLAIFKKKEGIFRVVRDVTKEERASGRFYPRNAEQLFARAHLMDPKALVVTLLGPGGTGKTTLAVEAGHKLAPDHYELMHVFRPTQELGEKQGFLPGTIEKKFAPWTTPVFDAFDLICNFKKEDIRDSSKAGARNRRDRVAMYVQDLVQHGYLEMSPINYIQGSNLRDQFVIIDEPQNFKKKDIKKIASRPAGESKLVLTGDPDQIAKDHMDAKSNGFVHLIDTYKGDEEFAHLVLKKKIFRGRIAEMANKL